MMIRDAIITLRKIFQDINIPDLSMIFEEKINNISNKSIRFNGLFFGNISKDIIMKKIKLPFFHEEIQQIMDNFPRERDKGEILDYLERATGIINKLPQEAIGKTESLDCLTKIFIPMRKQQLALERLRQALEELTKVHEYLKKLYEHPSNGPIRDIKSIDFTRLEIIDKAFIFPHCPLESQSVFFYTEYKVLCIRTLKTIDFWLDEWFKNQKLSLYHDFHTDPAKNLESICELRECVSLINNELKTPFEYIREIKSILFENFS